MRGTNLQCFSGKNRIIPESLHERKGLLQPDYSIFRPNLSPQGIVF